MKTEANAESAAGEKKLASVTLDYPIQRGETKIETVQLRRPNSGELRGLSLVRLGQMDVDEIRKLLPRITIPTLLAEEVDRLDPADLMELAGEVGDFLLSKERKAALPTT